MTATPAQPPPPVEAPGDDPAGARLRGAARGFSSLYDPQFRALWFGLLFSQGAMQINMVARPWLAYHVSGSGAALGIVAVASGLPMVLFSVIAGVVVDRTDKRRLLLVVTALLAVLSLATAVLVHLDIIAVWHLALVGMLQGGMFAFNFPTRSALIPALVSAEDLPNAIAMNSTGLNLNRVAVPAVAGLLIAWQPAVAFDVITLLYVISTLMLLRLPTLHIEPRLHSAFHDMVGGFRYVWETRAVRRLLLLALFPTLLGMPFQQFLPVFQEQVLHVGPSALGLMFSAVGIGSLTGSLAVAYLPQSRLTQFQMLGGFAFGLALVGFALSTTVPMALGMLALVGLTSQGYFVLNNVLLMNATQRDYYGRTMSIYMITWSIMPVAVLPMGVLIDAVGMPWTQAAAGVILTAIVGAILLLGRWNGGTRPHRGGRMRR
ncbi:MAG: MFS transporter [Dehalococcoidia bacterium]